MSPPAKAKPRRTQQERSEATTAQIIAAARALFAQDGYAATSLEEIATKANVTKGAVYHHFSGKREIFRMVYEIEQRRLVERETAAYLRKSDPWEAFNAASRAFLDASLDPGVQRITLLDAPAALGWDLMREIEAGAMGMMKEALERAMDAGCIPRRPAEPLTYLLFGALCEAAMKIARSENPKATLRAMNAELRRLFDALAAAPSK